MINNPKDNILFKHIFRCSVEGILIIDDNGIIIKANPASEQMFGYKNNELIQKEVESLVPLNFKSNHKSHGANNIRKPTARRMGNHLDFWGLKKDGSQFQIEISLTPTEIDNKQVVIAFIIDITKQKKAEEKLRDYTLELKEKVIERTKELTTAVQHLTESNVRLQDQIHEKKDAESKVMRSKQLLDDVSHNFPRGFITVVDLKFRIVFIEGEELVELGFKNLADKEAVIDDVAGISDYIKEKIKENIVKTLKGEHLSFEIEYKDKHYLVNTTPLSNKDNKIEQVLLVFNNVTLQKKAEFEMFNTLKKEQELSELKSRFISMASHEFRTPLSAILSSAILIEKQNEAGKEDKRLNYVSKIRSNVKNLVVILNDFLSLSKLQEGKIINQPIAFNLVDFSKSLVEELDDIKKSGQIITVQCDHLLIEAFLDLKLFKHIIYNLVSNAIKYSEENKEIIIKIEVNNQHVSIKIIDRGIGIPIEDQNNMFQRFYRANNASNIQGTGLGLNIVKQYTELMGGTISFKSQLNKGTTFYIEFPLNLKYDEENTSN